HLSRVPHRKSVPPVTLLQAYRQISLSGHSARQYEEYSSALAKQLATSDPDNAIVLSDLARQSLSRGSPQGTSAAIKYLARAIQLGSTSVDDYILLAELDARSNHLPDAVRILKRGISLAPYTRELYESLAVRYVKLGQYGESLKVINKGLELFPEDTLLRILLDKVKPAILAP
ncbi:MAG: tetratricopeptide repeat protein, partial [Candidatus Dormibacteraceae bacterium]